ncbi:type I toxin-antitoxin system Hok family toxin [Salmonella enterica]|nr:type I toxin-antitoxin system Hok family toxin [Salmonella enterica]
MKLPQQPVIWCVLIVCLTLLIFTYLTRSRLCEVRLKDGKREVAATLAYECDKKSSNILF